ncbi:MAG: bifunctional 4-hydroxy-2-oxoglutarate aldolase/2-dehydro-3-deoxy-phosphogluconate aldolase [Holophagales bacterium]|nr:bifunctional 4-hydroxy-2-oxoglutarate aldolase/2-dehydro-3-deoxy-phosphogluconate aldolase [Holophagales bacterium]
MTLLDGSRASEGDDTGDSEQVQGPAGRASRAPSHDATLQALLGSVPVIPVLTVQRLDHAVPLARALAAGGLRVLEITLRTEAAEDAIRRIAAEVPEAVVGAGTVTHPAQLEAVAEAGAAFAVSPGLPADLRDAGARSPVPLLPGVMTPTEAMAAHDAGFRTLKLFPAEAAGGRSLLKSLAGPLPQLRFCPTGGIGSGNFLGYLALPNVLCVGGSWLAPAKAAEQGDFARITGLAREAVNLATDAPSEISTT